MAVDNIARGMAASALKNQGGGGGITVTNTAAVGQTVKITAVDETGQPTEWEAVDMEGYTPVRGTDYWTAEDQRAIVDDVLAALPAWEGGSY